MIVVLIPPNSALNTSSHYAFQALLMARKNAIKTTIKGLLISIVALLSSNLKLVATNFSATSFFQFPSLSVACSTDPKVAVGASIMTRILAFMTPIPLDAVTIIANFVTNLNNLISTHRLANSDRVNVPPHLTLPTASRPAKQAFHIARILALVAPIMLNIISIVALLRSLY